MRFFTNNRTLLKTTGTPSLPKWPWRPLWPPMLRRGRCHGRSCAPVLPRKLCSRSMPNMPANFGTQPARPPVAWLLLPALRAGVSKAGARLISFDFLAPSISQSAQCRQVIAHEQHGLHLEPLLRCSSTQGAAGRNLLRTRMGHAPTFAWDACYGRPLWVTVFIIYN